MKKILLLMTILTFWAGNTINANELNIYTSRNKDLILPLIEKYTQATGVKVNIRYGKSAELINRIQIEGERTPADIVIIPDVGNLHKIQKLNLLQRIDLDKINQLDTELKAPDNSWVALTKRARVIAYNQTKLEKQNITINSYLDLAQPKLKERVCIRSSSNVYNQSLIAYFIQQLGERKTKQWLTGFIANFSKNPSGNDRDQILYIKQGICDVTLINTYYLSLIEKDTSGKFKRALDDIKIVFPQDELGTHYNISGVGLLKFASNKTNAVKFIKYMLSKEAQELYAQLNYEFPVMYGITLPKELQKHPKNNGKLTVSSFAKHSTRAIFLMDDAGWK